MALYRTKLPQTGDDIYLAYTGMETDLMFTQGVDLQGFASFPLLETEEGRKHLRRYFNDLTQVARAAGTGVILKVPTWFANRDRGAEIGYSPKTLTKLNALSATFMATMRDDNGDLPTILSANIGPRSDAYAPSEQMSRDESEQYHTEQIGAFANTEIDLISGYTIAYPEEAIGIVLAAKRFDMPVIIAFTVETDGCLPTGISLSVAIEIVDEATDDYASYFMINCAHPDHFAQVLSDKPWMTRLKGVVANASRCGHAELDECKVLDDGNPEELGKQLAEINRKYPNINILGGCCGTDMRHMTCIAQSAMGH